MKKRNKTEEELKDFVRDNFFLKGYFVLKLRQIGMTLVFTIIVLLPIIILFDSLLKNKKWYYLYWTYTDGFQLTRYLEMTLIFLVVFILVISLALLFRNNYLEERVYPEKITYNKKMLEKRESILELMYTERFGDKETRERSNYYEVNEEQNISDYFIEDLFKKEGVEIV